MVVGGTTLRKMEGKLTSAQKKKERGEERKDRVQKVTLRMQRGGGI